MPASFAHALSFVLALSILWNTFRRRRGVLTEPNGNAGGTLQNRNPPKDRAMTSDDDFAQLDDVAFLAERKRVRECWSTRQSMR
jgi:hypothetical protein